ncbi:MAG: diacylglycerol/lipid kinase family protein, partial [Geminicoccaceae bacterium]
MQRLAVISNPRSQRNRQGALAAVKHVVDGHAHVCHEELSDFAELGAIIERSVADGVEVIAVNGGDGTVQAVLTELGRRDLNGSAPKLAVLAGGMTNVIAKDVGIDGPPEKGLRRLLVSLTSGSQACAAATRPLIGLALRPDEPPVYGMF